MENAKKNSENLAPQEHEIRAGKPKYDGPEGLRDLLLHELKSMYYVEKLLVKSFPKMIKHACNYELIEAITLHSADTKKQIIRIEDTFSALEHRPIFDRNKAVECLLDEIDEIVELTKFGIVRDAGIILALHKIEHYEVATYTILSTYAENLKNYSIQALMEASLNEEKVAQMRLAKIAQTIQFYDAQML
ncbi:DUF892 family protein [Flavobacterium sp. CYK-4]|uniref:DUF892 family protein n=1 Tax=Flavobacterium lotistagni TaxID=2709660 RepID=UPI001407E02D|nr:DUF892 family protein [Flavobacterium lotistagni]NHM07020.1 DUF892 family protein [Flavobacterium lotistagni]